MKVRFVGSVSLTTTLAAVSGPRLVTVTRNVTGSPTAGAVSLIAFATATSAVPVPFRVTLARSLAGFGSISTCVFVTVLTIAPAWPTRAAA